MPKTISIGLRRNERGFSRNDYNNNRWSKGILENSELAADISDKGIFMTGGGALLYGLDKLMEEKTGCQYMWQRMPYPVLHMEIGKALENLDSLQKYNWK